MKKRAQRKQAAEEEALLDVLDFWRRYVLPQTQKVCFFLYLQRMTNSPTLFM